MKGRKYRIVLHTTPGIEQPYHATIVDPNGKNLFTSENVEHVTDLLTMCENVARGTFTVERSV